MTPPDTPEAVERLADEIGRMAGGESFHCSDAAAALRAYAQLLRRVEAVERERAEAFRLLRKAQAQASNVMQTWYEGEDEALAALGLRWPWELDGEPGAQT